MTLINPTVEDPAVTPPQDVAQSTLVTDASGATDAETYDVTNPTPDPGPVGVYDSQINPSALDNNYAADYNQRATDMGAGTTSQFISPEATVAYQLDTLLNTDSAYMKAAEAKAREDANRKGMLSTSMAIGAAHRQAIEAGLPIAQQDAETYAKSDINKQTQAGESALQTQKFEQDAQLERQRFGQQGALDRSKAFDNLEALRLQGEINFEQEKMAQEAQDRRFEIEYSIKEQLENSKLSSDERRNYLNQMTSRGNQWDSTLATLLRDPSFANEYERQKAIDIARTNYEDDVNFMASAAGVELTWNGVPYGSDVANATPDVLNLAGAPIDMSGIQADAVMPSGGQADLTYLSGDMLTAKTEAQSYTDGTYFAPMAARTYSNFDEFMGDLSGMGATQSTDYTSFTNNANTAYWEAAGQPETFDAWHHYAGPLYFLMNPENASARDDISLLMSHYEGMDRPAVSAPAEGSKYPKEIQMAINKYNGVDVMTGEPIPAPTV